MRLAAALAVFALLTAPAAAHPHAYVVQQASLSLSRTQATLTYRIAPSTKDGAHIFEHLDDNRDGVLSAAEKAAFAAELLAATALVIDGKPVRATLVASTLPPRATMAAGGGVIEVTAKAPAPLPAGAAHAIALNVTFDHFAKDWFLQPYFFPDVATPAPRLERRSGSAAIRILVAPSA